MRRLLVVVFVAGLGFAGGWYFAYQRANAGRQALIDSQQSTERQLADLKTETAAEIATLEKQVLEAQKAELERALERAKRRLAVDEVLESLAAASVDVEARNFGRAVQKIDQTALDLESMAPSTDVRRELEGLLKEIRSGLEQLDPSVAERITGLARDLEQGLESSR
jgi:Tfp pilus assembly protein PilO